MNDYTEHGENIANQIQDDDAYGAYDDLIPNDVWLILDNLHSHFLYHQEGTEVADKMMRRLERWMRELETEEGCG